MTKATSASFTLSDSVHDISRYNIGNWQEMPLNQTRFPNPRQSLPVSRLSPVINEYGKKSRQPKDFGDLDWCSLYSFRICSFLPFHQTSIVPDETSV